MERTAVGRAAYALIARFKQRKHIIAVFHAAPAPVDMVITFGIHPVKHEEVSLEPACNASVGHRAAVLKLVDEHRVPVGLRVIIARHIIYALVIAEMLQQRGSHRNVCSTRGGTVGRLERSPDMIQQRRDRIDCVGRGSCSQFRKHRVPIVLNALKILPDQELLVSVGSIGHRTFTVFRPLVVIHDLAESGGNATRGSRAFARGISPLVILLH